jgi:hypothetical protein
MNGRLLQPVPQSLAKQQLKLALFAQMLHDVVTHRLVLAQLHTWGRGEALGVEPAELVGVAMMDYVTRGAHRGSLEHR